MFSNSHTTRIPCPTVVSSIPTLARRVRSLGLRGVVAASIALPLLSLLSTTPAQAATLTGGACPAAPLSQPFKAWGDLNYYQLVAGGDFEGSLSGWTLSGGAQRVSGSEPYGVTGKVGAYSLSLPAGASATSPFSCVNIAYPSFRFFARNGGIASSVLVQVLYKTLLGTTVSVPVGTYALGGSWQPSAPMLTASIVGGVLAGGAGSVALRFTAVTGSSSIDDVLLDPRMR